MCSTLSALVNYMEARYDFLDSNIRNTKVATLTIEWWKVLKTVRDNRFPDHDLWWCFFVSGLDFIMPYDAGAENKESNSDDLMCEGPLPLLFDSVSVEAGVAMMKEVMLDEIYIGDSAIIADRTPTHNTHLCNTVCSQARNESHALGASHTDCTSSCVRLKRTCQMVRTCLILCCSHLPFTTSISSFYHDTRTRTTIGTTRSTPRTPITSSTSSGSPSRQAAPSRTTLA